MLSLFLVSQLWLYLGNSQVSFYRTIGPLVCIYENKDADQLRSNCAADLRLCLRYVDRTMPLLPKSKIASLLPSSVAVQPDFYQIWFESPKASFLTTRLIHTVQPDSFSTVGAFSTVATLDES